MHKSLSLPRYCQTLRGCLKKPNHFPLGKSHLKRFPLCIVSAGGSYSGASPRRPARRFLSGLLGAAEQRFSQQCHPPGARGQFQLSVSVAQTAAALSHSTAPGPATALLALRVVIYALLPRSLGSRDHGERRRISVFVKITRSSCEHWNYSGLISYGFVSRGRLRCLKMYEPRLKMFLWLKRL